MNKDQLREILLKAKLYRIVAMTLAGGGLIIFVFLYLQHTDGNILNALRNPLIFVIALFPFLPAAVLTWIAVSLENTVTRELEKMPKKE